MTSKTAFKPWILVSVKKLKAMQSYVLSNNQETTGAYKHINMMFAVIIVQ